MIEDLFSKTDKKMIENPSLNTIKMLIGVQI